MAVASEPPVSYFAAVYICVSILVGMLLVLLFYVLCSKKYRLNWFEQTVLQAAQDTDDASPTPVATPITSPPASAEFWVPSTIHRQASLCQSEFGYDLSGDESVPGTPNTPMGIKMSPFAVQQVMATGVQPVTNPRPKLTSMHSKLDHTKIDAALYQKPSLVRTPSVPEDMKGSVQFSLSYDLSLGLMAVQLVQARDLVAQDFSGTADPYAKVRLLPDKTNVRQSHVHKNTLNPVFDEEFALEVSASDLPSCTLEILLFDFDQFSRHKCLGNVQLPMEHIDLTEKVTLWKGISACDEKDDKPELGDVMFSLGYLPSAERLTVVVLKARDLRAVDETRNSSDPYVKVSLMQNGRRIKKKKTTTQRNTLQPTFNEALTFSLNKEILKTITLELSVLHDSLLGTTKEMLGRVLIGPNSKGDEAEHFREMLSSKTAVARWHSLIEAE